MHTMYIIRDIKKMSVNEIRGFIFEKNRLERKDLSLLVNKLIEKIPDQRSAKQLYE